MDLPEPKSHCTRSKAATSQIFWPRKRWTKIPAIPILHVISCPSSKKTRSQHQGGTSNISFWTGGHQHLPISHLEVHMLRGQLWSQMTCLLKAPLSDRWIPREAGGIVGSTPGVERTGGVLAFCVNRDWFQKAGTFWGLHQTRFFMKTICWTMLNRQKNQWPLYAPLVFFSQNPLAPRAAQPPPPHGSCQTFIGTLLFATKTEGMGRVEIVSVLFVSCDSFDWFYFVPFTAWYSNNLDNVFKTSDLTMSSKKFCDNDPQRSSKPNMYIYMLICLSLEYIYIYI